MQKPEITEEMAEMIRSAGLANVTYSNMTFGIACIHRATKPLKVKTR